jgi:outer membrane lipopolysaccharide assembly protein LptE/RlpB
MAAELAVIIALATALLATGDGPTPYRTLGARNATTTGTATLVVVFDPSTTESDLRRILREAGVRIADGPTQANAYVLRVATGRQGEAVRTLRAEPAVVLVEQLDSGEAR